VKVASGRPNRPFLAVCRGLQRATDRGHVRREASMTRDYVPLLVLAIVAGGFAVTNAMITLIVGPFRPTREKLAPYESGMTEIQPPRHRFPVKFYVIAMLFLLFDIEALSFFPWAILLRGLRFPGFIEMLIFIAILAVGFIYIWKKGALVWE
jgi:NADH-quinone oxidoreductase subunit A